jgi:hypothetical protein
MALRSSEGARGGVLAAGSGDELAGDATTGDARSRQGYRGKVVH